MSISQEKSGLNSILQFVRRLAEPLLVPGEITSAFKLPCLKEHTFLHEKGIVFASLSQKFSLKLHFTINEAETVYDMQERDVEESIWP